MRRADRLFQLMLLLQEGRVMTAPQLGEALEVSERTIYRDISDLMGSGIPIDGEAGVGYLLRDEYRLPPLMFNREELQALSIGARMVRAWADTTLREVAVTAMRKIESVLPEDMRRETEISGFEVPGYQLSAAMRNRLELLRRATDSHRKVRTRYDSLSGEQTCRMIWPLILSFWGNKWTLGAWCEMRKDFRVFRVDLMSDEVLLEDLFEPEPGKNLESYLSHSRSD